MPAGAGTRTWSTFPGPVCRDPSRRRTPSCYVRPAEAESREIMAQFVTDFGTTGTPTADGRLDAPAFHRNRRPIWSVLAGFLADKTGDRPPVGSGAGPHPVGM